MLLSELLRAIPGATLPPQADVEITGLVYDSRQVTPGSLFVAVPGHHVDGHRFIEQALARGATALLVQDATAACDLQVPVATYSDTRVALAPLAAAFYNHPACQLRSIGITGTDGKTTTTFLTALALDGDGRRSGMISTVDFKVADQQWANSTRQSTPEGPEVQELLRRMVVEGCTHAVIEATSHALSARLSRLDGCAFDVAVLTNISHEHLDFHGSFAQYRRDKARLFEMLGEPIADYKLQIAASFEHTLANSYQDGQVSLVGSDQQLKRRKIAIVNANDSNHGYFLDAAPRNAERLTYGVEVAADVRAEQVVASRDGLGFALHTPWGNAAVNLKLSGTFNVWNSLAALCVALVEGVPLEQGLHVLQRVPGVRGRMERVEMGQPFTVLVDYAHTPGSFEKLFSLMRPLTDGKLVAVFGSAGERDREKRAIQGEVAARYCDLLVLTDEDPRFEDRDQIIAEIAAGAKRGGVAYRCVPERSTAIRAAFEAADPGDIVLLLGKGHEGSIIYGNESKPWNEVVEARRALGALGYGDVQ